MYAQQNKRYNVNVRTKEETRISKYISLLLRHHPEKENLVMDGHGWVSSEALIKAIGIDMDLLEKIVREDEKQRYAFNEDHTKIRASQGHSVPVDVGLQECIPPMYLFHGTGEKYLGSIRKQGLLPQSRLYVHLSPDADTAYKVGVRHGRPVILTVKAGEMQEKGHVFYLSANGVWLTADVPAEYLIFPEEQ